MALTISINMSTNKKCPQMDPKLLKEMSLITDVDMSTNKKCPQMDPKILKRQVASYYYGRCQ